MKLETILELLAGAAERGTALSVPEREVALLAEIASCAPDAGGHYHFNFPLREAVISCGWPERLLALVLLLLMVPVLIVLALLVLLCDGSPVLFRQERYGCGGCAFKLWKFRTMEPLAETLQGKLQLEQDGEERPFKLANDPRVTRLGALLRRTFLDELPQLYNVVRGEMRLVGPRPLPASDSHLYRHSGHKLRLAGMPGITGLWQVSGRHRVNFDEMCLLDIYYLCNASPTLDARIVCKTFGTVGHECCLRHKSDGGGQ